MRARIVSCSLFFFILAVLPVFASESLPPDLQQSVGREHLQSIGAEGAEYVVRLGVRYHEASSQEQQALVRRALVFIASARPEIKAVVVKDALGAPVGVLAIDPVRSSLVGN